MSFVEDFTEFFDTDDFAIEATISGSVVSGILDEAFIDLKGTEKLHGDPPALSMARLVQQIEQKLKISASIGLSYNKYLAKLASDLDKPRGYSIIGKAKIEEFLAPKNIGLIWGVGKVAQIVSTLVEAAATGTTSIPYDDTIPQNNEGNEYMTLAITPTNSSSVLRIDVKITSSNSTAGQNTGVALFQDSTAGALASALQLTMGDTELQEHSINHTMTAGTTSETTFKVRAGRHSAGTFYFNSKGGTSYHGGVLFSSIIITEYLP